MHKHAWRETKTLFYKLLRWEVCYTKFTVTSEHLLWHTNVMLFSRNGSYCLYKIINCCLCQWYVQGHVEEELLEEKEKRIEELEKEVLNIYIADGVLSIIPISMVSSDNKFFYGDNNYLIFPHIYGYEMSKFVEVVGIARYRVASKTNGSLCF